MNHSSILGKLKYAPHSFVGRSVPFENFIPAFVRVLANVLLYVIPAGLLFLRLASSGYFFAALLRSVHPETHVVQLADVTHVSVAALVTVPFSQV